MLNSNFDLRTFLTESKATKEVVKEATLTEATVMEYIREKMDSMNNEVRSCMREYLNTCNEIDPSHEDAHAQLMGALEDFYSKLKAHFEADQAENIPVAAAPVGTIGDEPLEEGKVKAWAEYQKKHNVTDKTVKVAKKDFEKEWEAVNLKEGEDEALYKIQTTTPDSDPTIQKLSKRGADDLEKSMDIVSIELVKEEEDEFGGEEDQMEEAKVKITPPGEEPYHALDGKEMSDEEADEFIEKSKNVRGMTKAEKVDEMTEALDPETLALLIGSAKTALATGGVPAAIAALSKYKDHPKVAKVIAKFEKHLDK